MPWPIARKIRFSFLRPWHGIWDTRPCPGPKVQENEGQQILVLLRRIEHLETRIKLLEEELRGGINLSRFYVQNQRNSGGKS